MECYLIFVLTIAVFYFAAAVHWISEGMFVSQIDSYCSPQTSGYEIKSLYTWRNIAGNCAQSCKHNHQQRVLTSPCSNGVSPFLLQAAPRFFLNQFSVFRNRIENLSSCLIYYLSAQLKKTKYSLLRTTFTRVIITYLLMT